MILLAALAAVLLATPPVPPPMPPSASVRVGTRTVKLAYGSYTWAGYSRRYPRPGQRTDLPRIAVARGTALRFRLGFDPTSLVVVVGGRTTRLPAERVVAWRASREGLVIVDARLGEHRARYLARLDLKN